MNRELRKIIVPAERAAWKLVQREVRAALPKGWTLYLMVGWGMCLNTETGRTVFADYPAEDAPARLPKGVRKACLMACDYVETFGFNNEKIEGKRK